MPFFRSFLFNDSILGCQQGAFVVCFSMTAILKSRWLDREGRSQSNRFKRVTSPLPWPAISPSPLLPPTPLLSLRSQRHTKASGDLLSWTFKEPENHSGNSLASIQKQELAQDNRFILKVEGKKSYILSILYHLLKKQLPFPNDTRDKGKEQKQRRPTP